MTIRNGTASLGILCCVLALAACGPTEEQVEVDRQEIQSTLEAYLPRLGAAYATGSTEGLEGFAAEKEIAMVQKYIRDVGLEGREIRATFGGLTVEDVTTWGYANAYVTTVERWNVEVYTTGGQRLSGEQRSDRVQYQLQREDGGWLILYRKRQDT